MAGRLGSATEVLKKLYSKEYAAERRREIDPARAARDYQPLAIGGSSPGPKDLPAAKGDTIYLTAADRAGNVVSLIQSIYESFGSGIVAGDTGIVLHNRGSLFSMQAGHPNALAPGKRPFHTLVPAMVLKDGRPWLSFGVMVGDMQAQGPVQVLLNLIDFGMTCRRQARPQVPPFGCGTRARNGDRRPGARRPRRTRTSRHLESGRLRRLSGNPDRSTNRRDDGRIGSEERRSGGRVLGNAEF